MKKIVLLLVVMFSVSLLAMDQYSGWCEQGNNTVTVSAGLSSATKVQKSFPYTGNPTSSCQITVYTHGTVSPLPTIYSDNLSTPLSNPFYVNADGSYQFFAANGRYDVVGTVNGITIFTVSNLTLLDPISATTFGNINQVRYVNTANTAAWAGSDAGGWINSALGAVGSGGTVEVGTGTYSYSTGIVLPSNVTLHCQSGAVLTYTGTGVGLDYNFSSNSTVSNCTFSNSTSATIVKLSGQHNRFLNNDVIGSNTGTMLWNTGDGVSVQSNQNIISGCIIGFYDFTGNGLVVDHAVDTHVTDSMIYSLTNNTTATDFLVGTGTSGLYVQSVQVGFGLHGLWVRNQTGGVGAYNTQPLFANFDQFFADTTSGGDAIAFHSEIGNLPVSFTFTNSWTAAAGLDNSGAVIVGTANGFAAYGGNGISFNGRSRRNALNGFYVSGSNYVSIWNSLVYSNNVSNNADGQGIYFSQGNNLSALGNISGNVLDSGGHQKYGAKVGTTTDQVRLSGDDFNSNETGPYLSNSGGITNICLNMYSTGLSCTLFGQFNVTGNYLFTLDPTSGVGTFPGLINAGSDITTNGSYRGNSTGAFVAIAKGGTGSFIFQSNNGGTGNVFTVSSAGAVNASGAIAAGSVITAPSININSTGLLTTSAQSGTGSLCMTTNCALTTPTVTGGNINLSTSSGYFKIKDQGTCTMAAGTCAAQNLGHTYNAAPNCFVSWNGTGTLTGILKIPSTTTTVTPASSVGSDTAVVNWFCAGN